MPGDFSVQKTDSINGAGLSGSAVKMELIKEKLNSIHTAGKAHATTKRQDDIQKSGELLAKGINLANKLTTLKEGTPEYKAVMAELNWIDNERNKIDDRMNQEDLKAAEIKEMSKESDAVEEAENNSAVKLQASKFDVIN